MAQGRASQGPPGATALAARLAALAAPAKLAILAILAILAMLGGLAIACTGDRQMSPAQATRSATAVGATIADLSGVNELLASDIQFTTDLLDQLFVQLLSEQADYADHPPTFAPELARSYSWSDDHRTLTFHLREDALWSDGVPITAEDVRWTWQAQIAPEVAWSYADLKDAITDVEVVDPHTVRYHFREAYTSQLLDAVEGKILPKHVWSQIPFSAWRQRGDWFRDNLVTSGPFRLAAWRHGEEVVLERNERYFDATVPKLDRVIFRVAPDAATHVDQLLAGALDFACGVTPADATRLASRSDFRVVAFDNRQYDYISWNGLRAPFDDPEVRRALTLAIDRQALIDALFKGYARVASSPIPSNIWAHDPTLRPLPYDPAAARRILEQKGFRDLDGDGIVERRGRPFVFELTTNSSNRIRTAALVMIQEQLRQVGVAATPRTIEIHSLTEANTAHEYDATISGWAIDTTLDLKPYFHSSASAGGYNFGSYRNAEVDRLLEAARRAATPESALPDLLRLQQILHAEQPYTFLWEPQRLCAVRADLIDVRPNSISAYFNLPEWQRRAAPGGS
ncbi:MAG: bac 5 protein [Acidobacteriota bacterium]|nr:bac 5 protein [Acidobacteriota bacterium]